MKWKSTRLLVLGGVWLADRQSYPFEGSAEEYENAVTSQSPSAKQACELYVVLLRPIPQVVKTRLVVVPDGSLNLIPLDGLVDEHVRYFVQHPSDKMFYWERRKGNWPEGSAQTTIWIYSRSSACILQIQSR